MKRGSSEMWWIIIGAVIALVVLIILIMMFTGKVGPLNEGLSECEGKGGVCSSNSICPKGTLSSDAFDCKDSGSCCLGAPKECTTNQEVCGTAGNCQDYPNGKSYCN